MKVLLHTTKTYYGQAYMNAVADEYERVTGRKGKFWDDVNKLYSISPVYLDNDHEFFNMSNIVKDFSLNTENINKTLKESGFDKNSSEYDYIYIHHYYDPDTDEKFEEIQKS